jgi:hypothetical protein
VESLNKQSFEIEIEYSRQDFIDRLSGPETIIGRQSLSAGRWLTKSVFKPRHKGSVKQVAGHVVQRGVCCQLI